MTLLPLTYWWLCVYQVYLSTKQKNIFPKTKKKQKNKFKVFPIQTFTNKAKSTVSNDQSTQPINLTRISKI